MSERVKEACRDLGNVGTCTVLLFHWTNFFLTDVQIVCKNMVFFVKLFGPWSHLDVGGVIDCAFVIGLDVLLPRNEMM